MCPYNMLCSIRKGNVLAVIAGIYLLVAVDTLRFSPERPLSFCQFSAVCLLFVFMVDHWQVDTDTPQFPFIGTNIRIDVFHTGTLFKIEV